MPLNRPHSHELISSVQEYLLQQPQDPKADLFYRRVAANVLGIVQREQQMAAGFCDQERVALQEYLNSTVTDIALLNQQLAQAIDNGDLAITPQLTNMLLQLAQAKLNIDNPKYLR